MLSSESLELLESYESSSRFDTETDFESNSSLLKERNV